MDINLSNQAALPAQQQSQPAPTATSEAGATQTVQKTPDNVVTATTQPSETSVRDDDALRRQRRGDQENSLAALEALKVEGLKTRVGYDNEQETVFLEILAPNSDQVIQRIPSESLVEFLASQVQTNSGLANLNGASNPLDQSI